MFEKIIVPENIKQQRLNICKACEHYKSGICKKCGCILNLKTEIAFQECPIKKWNKYNSGHVA